MSSKTIARSLFGLCTLGFVAACSPAPPHPSSPFDLAPASRGSARASSDQALHGNGGRHGDGGQGNNPGFRDNAPAGGINGFSGSTGGAASLGGPAGY